MYERSFIHLCSGGLLKNMSAQPHLPELKAHLEKQIRVKLNEGRTVYGMLIGFDHFMNLALRNAKIETPGRMPESVDSIILRGACVLSFEAVNV